MYVKNMMERGKGMNAASTAYVTFTAGGQSYTYHFTGVTSIEHNLALNLDNEAAQGEDIVNGAKNLSDQVVLHVIETDTEHSPGWSSTMLAAMRALKKGRHLCKVITSMATYDRMLLSEITATQDEENPDGWSGELVFMEYIPVSSGRSDNKTSNNSSTRRNTGSTGTRKVTSPFLQLLQKAGL